MSDKGNNESKVIVNKGVSSLSGITADDVMTALRLKHASDVFISECKNGETWNSSGMLRLDAWVLKRTWSPLTTIGYEVKVSRQDFEQDQKWPSYLDLCHEFYFVCPSGLIRATDVPASVGLIWVAKSGRLHTKRKAEHRQPDTDKLNGLLTYALMSRSRIVANMHHTGDELPNPLEYRKAVVERAIARNELADFIHGHIRDEWGRTRQIERDIKDREFAVEEFSKRLALLGITWMPTENHWSETNRVRDEIDVLLSHIDDNTLRRLEEAGRRITMAVEDVRKFHSDRRHTPSYEELIDKIGQKQNGR